MTMNSESKLFLVKTITKSGLCPFFHRSVYRRGEFDALTTCQYVLDINIPDIATPASSGIVQLFFSRNKVCLVCKQYFHFLFRSVLLDVVFMMRLVKASGIPIF